MYFLNVKAVRNYVDPYTLYDVYFLIVKKEKPSVVDSKSLLALENFLWLFLISDEIYAPYMTKTIQELKSKLPEMKVDIINLALVAKYEHSHTEPHTSHLGWANALAQAYFECKNDFKNFENAMIWGRILNIDPYILYKKLKGSLANIPNFYGMKFESQFDIKKKDLISLTVMMTMKHSKSFAFSAYYKGLIKEPPLKNLTN